MYISGPENFKRSSQISQNSECQMSTIWDMIQSRNLGVWRAYYIQCMPFKRGGIFAPCNGWTFSGMARASFSPPSALYPVSDTAAAAAERTLNQRHYRSRRDSEAFWLRRRDRDGQKAALLSHSQRGFSTYDFPT